MTAPHHPGAALAYPETPDRWLPHSCAHLQGLQRKGLAGLGVPAPGRVQSPLHSAPHPLLGLGTDCSLGLGCPPTIKGYFLPTP